MAERRVVIGLSGVPGSGKTTLLRLLLKDFPGAETLAYDRLHPGMSEQQVEDWLRRGGDPNEMALDNLVAALKDLTLLGAGGRSRSPVLFESGFGRAHKATGVFIDFSVWIDTPLDLAMSRAVQVFLRNVELNPAPTAAAEFVPRLTRYMQDYPMLRRMYLSVSERGLASADLVIDGAQPAKVSTALIKKALAERGIA